MLQAVKSGPGGKPRVAETTSHFIPQIHQRQSRNDLARQRWQAHRVVSQVKMVFVTESRLGIMTVALNPFMQDATIRLRPSTRSELRQQYRFTGGKNAQSRNGGHIQQIAVASYQPG